MQSPCWQETEQEAATWDPERREDKGAWNNRAYSAKEVGEETICMRDVYELFLHFYFEKG